MFDVVEVLDFAGPFEVFSRTRLVAGVESRRSEDDDPFDLFTVGRTGQTVTATINMNAASNKVEVSFSDISVATVTLTDGKHIVVYHDTPGTDATRHLVGYVVFDTALAPTAGTLAYDFPAPTLSFDY